MATTTSSPQWDSRNKGFISPSQLQQIRRQSLSGSTYGTPSPGAPSSPGRLDSFHPQQQQPPFSPSAPSWSPGRQSETSPQLNRPALGQSNQTNYFSFRSSPSFDGSPRPGDPSAPAPSTIPGPGQSTMKGALNVSPTPPPSQPPPQGSPGRRLSRQQRPGQPPASQPPAQGGAPASSPDMRPSLDQRRTSLGPSGAGLPPDASAAPLHPEIRSIVQLTGAHAHKVYFSGPLVRRVERLPDGGKPTKDEGWKEVWAQLGGTTLSVWDMKAIEEASKQGREVPPTYVNVMDAFVQVLGSVTVPATKTQPAKRYEHILTLNTAGSNLQLFSCPNPASLVSWAAALRLTAWEKSRLEEIYTAHLIRITLNDGRQTPSPLIHGRMEGWVRVRVAGHVDWKRYWMAIAAGASDNASVTSATPNAPRKRRVSTLFSSGNGDAKNAAPPRPTLTLHASAKPKDKKKPLLSVSALKQAFAVYPERPELISRSTLLKLEGTIGEEEPAGTMKGQEGWLLVMPELEGGNTQASEMLKWLIGIHDAFELYGRPSAYTWDPRDPMSMMFAYPVGPNKDLLFLDRDKAEGLDPRDHRTSSIRSQFRGLVEKQLQGLASPDGAGSPPHQQTPPIGGQQSRSLSSHQSLPSPPSLPPLSFDSSQSQQPRTSPMGELERRALTPITERSIPMTEFDTRSLLEPHGSLSGRMSDFGGSLSGRQSVQGLPPTVAEAPEDGSALGGPMYKSPSPVGASGSRERSPQDSAVFALPRKTHDYFGSAEPSPQPPALKTLVEEERQAPLDPANVQLPTSPEVPRPPERTPSPSFSVLTSPHSPTADRTQNSFASLNTLAISQVPYHPGQHTPSSMASLPLPFTPESSSASFAASTSPSSSPAIARTSNLSNSAKSARSAQSAPPAPAAAPPAQDNGDNLYSEAGARYYMQQLKEPSAPRRNIPPPPSDETEEDTESDRDLPPARATPPLRTTKTVSPPTSPEPPRRGTPMDFAHLAQTNGSSPSVTSRERSMSPQKQRTAAASPPPASPPRGAPRGMAAGLAHRHANGSSASVASDHGQRTTLTHRPSGARAPPASRSRLLPSQPPSFSSASPVSAPTLAPAFTPSPAPAHRTEPDQYGMSSREDTFGSHSSPAGYNARRSYEDEDVAGAADAMAVLSYLDQDYDDEPTSLPASASAHSAKSPSSASSPAPPRVVEPAQGAPSPSEPAPFRSSFAPSKQVAERRAKTQAQQAAHQVAVTKPGRANGRKGKMAAKSQGAWGESSEEEEEEDDDDEEVDSDAEPKPASRSAGGPGSLGHAGGPSAVRPLSPRGRGQSPAARGGSPGAFGPQGVSPAGSSSDLGAHPPTRPPRHLPQVPGGFNDSYDSDGHHVSQPQRLVSDQFSEAGRATNYENNGPLMTSENQFRSQPQYPNHTAARQTIWNQALEPGRKVGAAPYQDGQDTFVQLEPSEQKMTKAFTPHGLLSAGLQDKHDRSAKRQEELARETGASLLNVPNKPPPPQTGLLGAITAHERERKREGGFGAALTERERDKRLAEERQRKIDDFQRQQLEMAQNGGSMYGGSQFMNPMMMNPMMMGMGPMNPMMTGMGGMGPVNPMMTGMMGGMGGYGNPQHMFAAQQAAQAYQQAMMTFSMAGSQAGGDGAGAPGGSGAASPNPGQMNPMMTGNGMGMPMSMMGGFDPRMSMMMMGGGMMSPGPMGMQMTGAPGGFDPRFAGAAGQFNGGLTPPAADFAGQGRFSAQASASGSPAMRPVDANEDSPTIPPLRGQSSRDASPRP